MSSDTSRPESPIEEEYEYEYEYDDTVNITDYPSSFNLLHSDDRPDMRSITYKSQTDHLNCPICQQPFINPLTTICGHTFCKECIYECFRMAKRNSRSVATTTTTSTTSEDVTGNCPLDRTPLDAANINDLFPTPLIVTNLIDELKVYCLNKERGCGWVGTRWELEHHVTDSCGYTGIRCNGDRCDGTKCQITIERRFEDKESLECVHRVFECEYCNAKVTKITQGKHLEEECLFNYQVCELCGNDTIPQKNMKKHQENCLKMARYKCPAHEIGCGWSGTNESSLELHLESNCQLYQFLPTYTRMMDKVNGLTLENEFLQKQINRILDSIIQGKITNLGYSESIEEIDKFQSIEDQDKLMYLNFEVDRLKYEINERLIPFMNKSQGGEQESVVSNLINDNFMMREDMNMQRMMINSLRKQLQFLLFARNRNGGIGNSNGLMMLSWLPSQGDDPEMYEFGVSRNSSEERLNLKL
ncbi:TNF receptor-associated factor 4 [Candida viswanathii]|uniref:TNF receptor-associated factor 4 n=1 Tax=Candida viswanathii TaxID=5486 RepID=A0A367YBZ1_9ASCO|nr:TNF receptor-associated factor 4 [Candida viswanathii]